MRRVPLSPARSLSFFCFASQELARGTWREASWSDEWHVMKYGSEAPSSSFFLQLTKGSWQDLFDTEPAGRAMETLIFGYIWVNYNDLTATSLESWLIREIIPKWPYFRLVNYYNLPRYIWCISCAEDLFRCGHGRRRGWSRWWFEQQNVSEETEGASSASSCPLKQKITTMSDFLVSGSLKALGISMNF